MRDYDGDWLVGWRGAVSAVVVGISLVLIINAVVIAAGLIAAWLVGNFAGWWWLVAPQ